MQQKAIPKKSVSKFLKRYSNESTRRHYRAGMVNFLNYIYDIPETRRTGPERLAPPDLEFYDKLALQYLDEPQDYGGDITEYIASRGNAPAGSLQGAKTVVVSWLAANKIYLHPEETRRIRTGRRPRTRDRAPTRDELKRIMDHLDLQMKLFVLMTSSAGIRPGETTELLRTDVDVERGSIFVRAEIAKGKESRLCFMSTEAMETYREWIDHYPQYLEKVIANVSWRGNPPPDTNRIFPITFSNVGDKFVRALKKAGLDEKDPSTGRYVIHLHALRKFFRTRLPMGGATVDATEALMGHSGYLTDSYLRLTDVELEEEYRKAEPALWIYKTKPINEAELKHLERENQVLKGDLSDIRREIATMNATTDSVNSIVKAIESVISNPNDPEALTILLEARTRMAMKSGGET